MCGEGVRCREGWREWRERRDGVWGRESGDRGCKGCEEGDGVRETSEGKVACGGGSVGTEECEGVQGE